MQVIGVGVARLIDDGAADICVAMAEARDCGATRCVDVTLAVPIDDEDAVSPHCDGHFVAEHPMKDVVHSLHLLGNKLLRSSV